MRWGTISGRLLFQVSIRTITRRCMGTDKVAGYFAMDYINYYYCCYVRCDNSVHVRNNPRKKWYQHELDDEQMKAVCKMKLKKCYSENQNEEKD